MGKIVKKIKKEIGILREIAKNDPVRRCDYHHAHGCGHVDGFLCDMKTCNTLKEFKNET